MIKKLTMRGPKILNSIFLVFVFFACDSSKSEKSDKLPILGHYDVISEDEGDYKKGDTIFHQIPDFEYLTQDSVLLKSNQIDGKIWIAKFFFSSCPTICPPMTSSMKKLRDDLSQFDDQILYLSFSIDPKNDSPSRLREYIAEHQINNTTNWYFLTGVPEQKTHELGTKGFLINAFSDNNAPGGYAHSPNFILVDQKRHIRGLYDGLEPSEIEQLKIDLQKLIK